MKAAEGGHLKKVEDRGDGIINPFSTVIFNTVFENHRKSLIQHCDGQFWRISENLSILTGPKLVKMS